MNRSTKSLTLSTESSDLVKRVSDEFDRTGVVEVGALVRVLGDPTGSVVLTAQPNVDPKATR